MDSDRKNTNGSSGADVAGARASPGLSGGDAGARPDSGFAVRLDKATQARIGGQLRAMYGELLRQPVPERFRSLLERLDGGADRKTGGAAEDREASR